VARLSNGVNLIGYTLRPLNRSELAVTLYWLASGTPPQSYTVFTQVLDGEGQLVAGHDSFPANGETPTETWIVGRVYPDTHLIKLPDGLAAGTYQVVAGMYDFNLTRVVATGANAQPFQDRAVPLGQIPLP
jgi:hypothetical protein